MQRVRSGIGLLITVAAVAWGTSRGNGIRGLVEGIWDLLPWLLIAVALVALLAWKRPRPILISSAALSLAGLALLAVRGDWLAHTRTQLILAACGVALGVVMVLAPRTQYVLTEREKLRTFLWASTYVLTDPPARLTGTAVALSTLTIDLSRSTYPPAPDMHVFLRVLAGRVVLVLPESWTLRPGDLSGVRNVTMLGAFDDADGVATVNADSDKRTVISDASLPPPGWRERLLKRSGGSREAKAEPPPREEAQPEGLVLLHIAGVGGSVEVERR